MADLEEMKAVTARGVAAQSDMNDHLVEAYHAAECNAKATEAGVEAGMVKALKGKEMIWQARAIMGAIAEAGVLAAQLHQSQTAACVANNCDTGSLSTVAGVSLRTASTDGTVTTLGGGDR